MSFWETCCLQVLDVDRATPRWPGLTAALDEAGFDYIVSMQDGGQMWRFLRRLVAAHGGAITSEASLDKLVGGLVQRTHRPVFDEVLQELSGASWVSGFDADRFIESPLEDGQGIRNASVNLFIAGLEGTGHHFIKEIMDDCLSAGACQIDPELTRTLWDSRTDKATLKEAWAAAALRDTSNKLRVLNAYDRTDHMGEMTYTGMLTYPSFSQDWVPRLDLYSEVAREAGDKFFVLVLVRNPRTMLCSDFVRLKEGAEMKSLALNALVQQLQTLEPSAYHCLDYDTMPFVPPSLESFLGGLLQIRSLAKLFAAHYTNSTSACTEDEVSYDAVESLANAQQPLFDLCISADAAPPPVNLYGSMVGMA